MPIAAIIEPGRQNSAGRPGGHEEIGDLKPVPSCEHEYRSFLSDKEKLTTE